MIYAGIDAGSRTVKVVLVDENCKIISSGITDQGIKQAEIASELLEKTLEQVKAKRQDVARVVATGYGRDALDFVDTTITEITCHARGVYHLMSEAGTIIDIGGQDSKLIRLEQNGKVRDFVMNDRCAAGTGRFLEVLARELEINLQDLGQYAGKAEKPAAISSMCVVFAETEIIGLLASGESRENIVAGVQHSIATRISSMAGRNLDQPVILTGGVALIPGMPRAIEKAVGHPVIVSRTPQFTGALGAAILALP